MICHKCKHANSSGAKFCSACGIPISPEIPPKAGKVTSQKELENLLLEGQPLPPSKRQIAQIIVPIVIVGVIAAFVLFTIGPKVLRGTMAAATRRESYVSLAHSSSIAGGYLTFSSIHVPEGYRVVKQRGPDFSVYSLYAPSVQVPILNVYEGMAPSFPSFCGKSDRPPQISINGFKESTVRSDRGRCRETLLEIPGRGEVRHLWYHDLASGESAVADGLISRIHLVNVVPVK
jgi:hypothetical protein